MKSILFASATALIFPIAGAAYAQGPDAQARQRQDCTQNWTTVDTDRSGAVSDQEAKAVADAAFARIDIDADGELSVIEWNACGDPNGASASGINQPSSGAAAPWDADDFTAFDSDKSGDLSPDEAAEASRSSEPTKASDEDTARKAGAMFARVDANDNGMMSAEEWSNRNSQNL